MSTNNNDKNKTSDIKKYMQEYRKANNVYGFLQRKEIKELQHMVSKIYN